MCETLGFGGIRQARDRGQNGGNMIRLMLAALVAAFTIGSAAAQGTCESRAVGQDGRPLAGAAKKSFLTKCKREACAPKAVGSDGKPLKGAAKNSFMAKCQREA
jgi:hypothetical protein